MEKFWKYKLDFIEWVGISQCQGGNSCGFKGDAGNGIQNLPWKDW
jgi:hypothetical protein